MSHFVVNKQNFEKDVLKSDQPVLVDFWAVWCGPCKMTEPIFDELAVEYQGKIKFGKLNVDEEPEIAGQFGVMSIPTFLLFKDGKPIDTLIGVNPKSAFEEKLKQHQ